LAALLLLAVTTVHAQKKDAPPFTTLEVQAAQEDPRAYTIDESSIRVEKLEKSTPVIRQLDIDAPTDGPDPFVIIDKVINLGQKIWGIIEANKPVVDIKTQYGTATPQGITHWGQLAGWKAPQWTEYRLYAKNLYGATVIDVRFQVLRTCGGNYNGKGKYLTAVTIAPVQVDVLWGYKFNLSVEIPDSSVVNVGTNEDPVAAMQPLVKWTIATVIKSSDGRSQFYVQGDGLFKELGGVAAGAYKDDVAKALSSAEKVRIQ